MPAGTPLRRRATAVVALVVVAGTGAVTACGSQGDTVPTVASVDFEPRLLVVVDEGRVTVESGPRPGAEATPEAEGADWSTPAGSVVEVRNDSTGSRGVVVTTGSGASADEATVWVDTGPLDPGESVVLGLSAAADYTFSAGTDPGPASGPTVRVTPRPTT